MYVFMYYIYLYIIYIYIYIYIYKIYKKRYEHNYLSSHQKCVQNPVEHLRWTFLPK